jgi:hypothetical protein
VTVRWESALPIQQALRRQGGTPAAASEDGKAIGDGKAASDGKATGDESQKYYVISVLGFRLPARRSRSLDDDDHTSDDNDRGRSRQNNDALRSQLLDAAQLSPKGKPSIYASDVQIQGPNGVDGIRFLFPRTTPISAGDKEVDFVLEMRRIKVEEKFRLSDMQYEGKLAL